MENEQSYAVLIGFSHSQTLFSKAFRFLHISAMSLSLPCSSLLRYSLD